MKRKNKLLSPYQRFEALSESEKESVYRQCDNPDIARESKPLTPRLGKLWNKARNKGGRPRIGGGAKRVLVSIEKGLLNDADAFAKQKNITRSQLFSRGIRTIIARVG